MKLTIDIPDNVYPLVTTAFSKAYNYQTQVNNSPNQETVDSFLIRKVGEYIEEVTKANEINVAIETVMAATNAKVDTEIAFAPADPGATN